MPTVSIVLPIFRVEKYLARCLDSVCGQTLRDIEIILATDGPESCDAICREYAAKDPRISIIIRPGGYGQAINRGIDAAKGEYIGIVETDDWLEPSMFQKLYDMAKLHDVDLCKGAFYHSFNDPTKNFAVYTGIASGLFSLKDYPRILSYQPSVWSAVYKRTFLNKHDIRFMERRLSYLDVSFHLETFIRAGTIAFVNEPLYHYYQDNPEQSVKSSEKPLDGLLTEKHFYEKKPLHQISDKNIFESLVFTAVLHMLWNYKRLTSYENKQLFWREARQFARMFADRPIAFKEFTPRQKIFFKMLLFSPHFAIAELASICWYAYKNLRRTIDNCSDILFKAVFARHHS